MANRGNREATPGNGSLDGLEPPLSPRDSRSRSPFRSRSRSSSRSPSGSPRYRRRYSRSRSRSRSRHRRKSSSRSYSRSRSRSLSRKRRGRRSRSVSPLSDRKRHQGDRYNPKESKVLGVFGLSLYTGEKDLREIFCKYGSIDRVQVVYDHQTGRSRGFAFVYFKDPDDAVDAKEHVNGSELDGRRIRVDFSITKRPHTPTPGVYMGRPTRSDREGRDREGRDREGRDRDRDRGDRGDRRDKYDRDRYDRDNDRDSYYEDRYRGAPSYNSGRYY